MARKKLNTVNIKGKEYVPVNERIKAFREIYPNGNILTEMVHFDSDRVVFKACIYLEDRLVATGYAHEERKASNINATSYVENCETSAIGRALGIAGIGIDTSIASADETESAVFRQEALKPASDVTKKTIVDLCELHNIDKFKLFEQVGWKKGELLTAEQAGKCQIILKDITDGVPWADEGLTK